MKLVFMGTPDFAVPCLDALTAAGHEIAAVFTQPDKPKGRKYVLTPPPVKVWAQRREIPVYQPQTLRDAAAEQILRGISPDMIVVVAYGKLLPEAILNLPRCGCVNVHASLLPRHRGASPIQWAIVCGDRETGVCTMRMDVGMDTGDILERAATPIDPDENFERLHDRLSEMGAKLIVSTLDGLTRGSIRPTPQPEEGVTKAPIITKEMGLLDFTKPARELHNLIRGFDPWPSAYTFLNGRRLKVIAARPDEAGQGAVGAVVESDGRLTVGCGAGTLELLTVQPAGKPKMSAAAFLQGHPVAVGTVLG